LNEAATRQGSVTMYVEVDGHLSGPGFVKQLLVAEVLGELTK